MKKTYKIEIDCANCANLVEAAAAKVEGVKSVSISYMAQKMSVEFEDGFEPKAVMETIFKTGRKIEPDFEIEM